MRIIHLFVILSIFLFGNVFASAEKLDSIGCTLFCCIYKHKVKTTDLNGKNVNDSTIAILEVGDNVSKYEDYSAYQGKGPVDTLWNIWMAILDPMMEWLSTKIFLKW